MDISKNNNKVLLYTKLISDETRRPTSPGFTNLQKTRNTVEFTFLQVIPSVAIG